MSRNKSPHKTPLVLLPGWGFNVSVWQYVVSRLPSCFEPVLLDLPYTEDLSLSSEPTKLINNLLARKIPDNAIIAGWSLGGMLAVNFCYQRPELNHSVITLASSPKITADEHWPGVSPKQARRFLSLADQDMERLQDKFAQLVTYPFNTRDRIAIVRSHMEGSAFTEKWRFYLKLLFSMDCRALWTGVSPGLQLLASHDAIVPSTMPRSLAYQSQRPYKLIDNSPHAVLVSNPQQLAELIHDWYDTAYGNQTPHHTEL